MIWKITVLALVFASLLPMTAAAAELRVGAAAESITPAVGTPMSGFYSTRVVQAVDDELYAKAIVIECDGVRVALVACDLITMPRPVVEEARRLIAEGAGIPADHVMISATHTHTGPLLQPKSSEDPKGAEAAERVRAYVKALPERIAESVRKADAKLAPARVRAGVGQEPRLSFNRRYFMKDGTVGWNPGKLNPETDRPAGPVDPDVPVVYFESADKAAAIPIATHVSFAMHPDTRHGEHISADYPGQLAEVLARVKGPEMLTLFATGACGDINHVNVNFRGGQISPKESARLGMILAGEVLKVFGRMQPVDAGAIRVKSELLALPLPEVKSAEIEQARETLAKPPASTRVSMEHVRALKVLDVAGRQGKPLDAEVQVITLGDEVAWVALPGEIFAELGLEIKKRSPFKHTILVTIANGSVGYVPTKRAFMEGSYEPFAARCAPGSGETVVETAVRLLNELKPAAGAAAGGWRNPLVKQGYLDMPLGETTPFVFKERLYLMETYVAFVDSASKAVGADAEKDVIRIRDVETQKIVSTTLPRHSFATAFVWDGRVYLFAAKRAEGQPWRTSTEVSMTSSDDLKRWSEPQVVWRCEPGEQVFNVAVCRGPERFVLLCETNDPKYVPFTFKYFESSDLVTWKPIPGALYGTDKYVGGPALYYENGWYHTLYLHHLRAMDYETRITRSRDLKHWQDAPADRPFLTFDRTRKNMPLRPPELTESNASDAELCYFDGKTIVYFSGGDQQYAGDLQRAEFDGTPRELFERFFEGVAEPGEGR